MLLSPIIDGPLQGDKTPYQHNTVSVRNLITRKRSENSSVSCCDISA